MSGRGRGRGGGGGRGQPRSDQPQSASSSGRGGGTGGGGRGRGRRRGRGSGPESGESAGSPVASHYPSASEPSSSVTNLSREVETKLTLVAPAPSQPAPTLPPPIEPSRSAEPQPSSSQSVQLPPSSSRSLRPPARPGFGTLGRKCVVRANHFLVKIAERDLHHYDVSIDPEVSSKKVCRDIIGSLADAYRESHLGRLQLAYDGKKNIYTAGPLPFNSRDFVVNLVDNDNPARRERQFTVAIKFVGNPDLHHLQQFLAGRQFDTPQEIIQVLDVVLRTTPSNNYSVVGRSFFARRLGNVSELGEGLLCYQGFYQSLRPIQFGLSLNIDMSARAFYEPILVIDFVTKYLNVRDLTRPLADQDRVKVKKALKGIKIELDHRESVKRYKITGVSTLPMSQLMFTLDDGRTVSVVQYFRERYNIHLRYAFLPALQAGSDRKPAYLPMEISKIVEGQRYSRKLNEKQVTAMLRATCQRPNERERSIKQMVGLNNYNNDAYVNEFGLQVRSELTVVDARVLQPPTLMYNDTGVEARVNPTVGQWNMINKKMVNGGSVEFWTCVTFSRTGQDQASFFCAELVSMCISKGIDFNRSPLLPTHSAHPRDIEKVLCDIHARSNAKLESIGQKGKCLQLLIVILPDFSGSYGRIKRVCETELGLISQCCQPKHVSRLSKQYLENVALKINVKVGGRNTVLLNPLPLVSDRPTIIFGADVTHPQPGEDCSPSIAAVVASMDWPGVTKYRGLVSAQPHREEIILDLYKKIQDPQKGIVHSGMIRELLIAFWKSTNRKPCRIIFYRDGVSEGQFNQVLLYEMDAIRKACVSLEENYLPPVTFVVVQKRHHTRLFPAEHNNRNMTDRSGNILPGTVVDTGICHPTEFDFYLCSHSGIQGTSRPTHYHVLYDENKFTADALQTLTNNICYTYARCTRSVSIVPPAYYAHLAAFRARYYIEGEISESGSTSGGDSSTRDRNVEVRPLPAIRENVKDVMFYC